MLAVLGASPAAAQKPAPSAVKTAPPPATGAPREALVSFEAGLSSRSRAGAVAAAGGRLGDRIGSTRFHSVAVRGREAIDALRRAPGVAAVEENHRRQAAAMPDDPQTAKFQQGFVQTLRLPAAWDRTHADGEIIAVVDSGVDLDHPDLEPALLPGRDLVDGDARPEDDSASGHGTRVAGVAAAVTNNDRGIAGVAWGAKILPVKVLGPDGTGDDATVAAGITWAADQGARVIVLSLGGPAPSAVLTNAIAYAAAQGAVTVAAAGNTGLPTAQYPAASPGVVAVSATDMAGEFAYLSTYGQWVDVAAPGYGQLTTGFEPNEGDLYRPGYGTSFAAPVVAGVAALVAHQHPDWTPQQIASRITSTASDRGPVGFDHYYGHGVVDPGSAVGGSRLPTQRLAPADGNGDPASATPLSFGATQPVSGAITTGGEEDWFRVDVPRAGLVEVELLGGSGRGDADWLDATLEVYDESTRFVGRWDDRGGPTESATFQVARAGRHFLRIANYYGSRGPGPVGYAVRVGAEDPPATARGAETVEAGYHVAEEPRSFAIADATGDGRGDVLMTSWLDYHTPVGELELQVFPQSQEGWLQPPRRYPIGSHPVDMTAGDLDGDRDPDVAMATPTGIVVLRSTGTGYGAPEAYPAYWAHWIRLADLDGDGRRDIVYATERDYSDVPAGTEHGIFLMRNTGSRFAAPRKVSSTSVIRDLALGDLNSDGRVDIAATVQGEVVRVLRQSSTGTFAETTLDRRAISVAVGDVTGDGRADLLTGDHGGGDFPGPGMALWAQTPSGGLAAASSLGSWDAHSVLVADATGDGRADAIAKCACGTADVYPQLPGGGLGTRVRMKSAPDSPHSLSGSAFGDVTGDGTPEWVGSRDVLARYSDRPEVEVAGRRTAAWPRPRWVQSTTPADGATGVGASAALTVRFGRALDPASITAATVSLVDGRSARAVGAERTYDAATRTLAVRPAAGLVAGRGYTLRVRGVRDGAGARMGDDGERVWTRAGIRAPVNRPVEDGLALRFTAGAPPADTRAPQTVIVGGPSGRFVAKTRWSYLTDEQAGTFECSADGSRWYGCASKDLVEAFGGDRSVTHYVRARDTAGNVDPTPAVRRYYVRDEMPFPSNYLVERPQRLSGASGTITGSTSGSVHTVAPIGSTNPGGNARFYEWTAEHAGELTIDTAGTAWDTMLATIVPDADCGAGCLPLGIEDDDGGPGRSSRITQRVGAGTKVTFLLGGWKDGYPGGPGYPANGSFRLSWKLERPAGFPAASTSEPADVTPAGATLGAEVDANGLPTTYHFEWGAGTAFDRRTPEAEAGSGADPRSVSAPVSDLQPDREYRYRVVVQNSAGTVTGDPVTFRTPVPPPERPATPVTPGGSSAAPSVRADFDGDGHMDLVMGAPDADGGWGHDLGSAVVLYGTSGGPSATRTQYLALDTPDDPGWAKDEDRYGSALAAGDFDGDGRTDLAVGSPMHGDVQRGGAVQVLDGSPTGLLTSSPRVLTQDTAGVADAPEVHDGFGSTLAAGDLTGDGIADLAVGVPGENAGATLDTGAVHVLAGSASGLTGTGSQLWTQASAGLDETAETGDAFGSALATGDFDGDGRGDLAVGVPQEDAGAVVDAGAVHVLRGGAGGLTSTGAQVHRQGAGGLADAPEAGDGFGATLAAGSISGSSHADLAVGTPAEGIGSLAEAGVVQTLVGSAGGLTAAGGRQLDQDVEGIPDVAEAGDRFGGALVALGTGAAATAALAVGAPAEDLETAADAGAVHVLTGSSSGLGTAGSQRWTQDSAGVAGIASGGDQLGAALSGGELGGGTGRDLIAAAPGETVAGGAGAGAVHVLFGTSAQGVTATGSQQWTMDSPGVPGFANPGVGFGRSVGG